MGSGCSKYNSHKMSKIISNYTFLTTKLYNLHINHLYSLDKNFFWLLSCFKMYIVKVSIYFYYILYNISIICISYDFLNPNYSPHKYMLITVKKTSSSNVNCIYVNIWHFLSPLIKIIRYLLTFPPDLSSYRSTGFRFPFLYALVSCQIGSVVVKKKKEIKLYTPEALSKFVLS